MLIAVSNGPHVSKTHVAVPEFCDLKLAIAAVNKLLYVTTAFPSCVCTDVLSAKTSGVFCIGGTVKKRKFLAPALYMICAWEM